MRAGRGWRAIAGGHVNSGKAARFRFLEKRGDGAERAFLDGKVPILISAAGYRT